MTAKIAAKSFAESAENFKKLESQAGEVAEAAALALASLKSGGHLFFCGNGGSAADAQHIAAELVGRFMKERRPLKATALHANTSSLTAIGNDYSYDEVFSRQLAGLGSKGDVLFAITTSGNSKNILKTAEVARQIGMKIVGMTGQGGGKLAALCDLCLTVPSTHTPRIQEMHIAVGHAICEIIDEGIEG